MDAIRNLLSDVGVGRRSHLTAWQRA